MSDCLNLNGYIDDEKVHDAFSALVSGGKKGYKTVIERKKEIVRCSDCSSVLSGAEKFCPECGKKVKE